MAEFAYQEMEAWHTTVRLTVAVGRLKVGSNLKAAESAQGHAFEEAGLACASITEGSGREGPGQIGLYRDARAALARCRAWIHILAAVTNEQDTVFGNELDLAETASRQLGAALRSLDRNGPQGMAPRGNMPPPQQRPQGPRPGGGPPSRERR